MAVAGIDILHIDIAILIFFLFFFHIYITVQLSALVSGIGQQNYFWDVRKCMTTYCNPSYSDTNNTQHNCIVDMFGSQRRRRVVAQKDSQPGHPLVLS